MRGRGILAAVCACALSAPAIAHAAPERIGHLDVQVLTPPGYSAKHGKRWPVLYLIPGSGGDAKDAVKDLALDKWAGRRDALVAIVSEPYNEREGDSGGWNFIVDFHDGTKPLDTEFATKVVPWVDAHFRTRADRRHRAIAGYSSGGYSSAAVASRHPRLFRSVGAFSGLVDITDRDPAGEYAMLMPTTFDILDGEFGPTRWWGDPVADADNWHAQNPADMAARLKPFRAVYIAAGDGTPADGDELAEDGPGLGPQVEAEEEIGSMTRSYDARLSAAGVAHVYRPHHGTHNARHWREDLAKFWPLARAAFRERR